MGPTVGGGAGVVAEPVEGELAGVFPQFQILELIGSGGMGRVYKVMQPGLGRVAALKVLMPELAKDPSFVERFTREGRALARLQHPNIVSVFDIGETRGYCWLLMEYVDGVNLRQVMQSGSLSPTDALQIIPGVCAALEYAHGQGVLHRDIKPENILLDGSGRVKIADFGVAKLSEVEGRRVTLTLSGSSLGTPAYMAPEQIERPQDVDHRADIYSLGVVFYEMLTGELPLGRFPAPSETKGVDPRFDNVVFRTLEKQRERRYQTAGEMKTQVEQVKVGEVPPPMPSGPMAAGPGAAGPVRVGVVSDGGRVREERVSQKAVWGMVCTVAGVVLLVAGTFLTRRVTDEESRSRMMQGDVAEQQRAMMDAAQAAMEQQRDMMLRGLPGGAGGVLPPPVSVPDLRPLVPGETKNN
jgi:predicted Ser/Thr protein kinase